MGIAILIILGSLIVLFAILVVVGDMLVNIGGQQIGIMERRFVGRALPEARVVAMRGEVGIQARVLPPGLHFLPPFLYKVTKGNMILIQDDQIGMIESIDGASLDPGRIFARKVQGHDTYQDGEAFLRAGGQKGPQIDILAPGQYRINTYLFRIKIGGHSSSRRATSGS